MKALVFDKFGGPEVYRIADLPIPEPGEGEVQVRVDGAGMNPADWKIREGKYPAAAPKEFPAVALLEFSGTVSKLGGGVTEFAIGDEIYGLPVAGAAAQYAIAKVAAIGYRPVSMDAADAGVVPLAGMTAWQALFDHGQLESGQRVLIHAAAGGVGTFAVQLAKWKGAYVIGTARKENHHLLQELGADELIDYTEQKVEDAVSNVDMVLHSIGPEALPSSLAVLKTGGRLICISAMPDVDEAKRQGKTALNFSMSPNPDQLRQMAGLIEDLQLRPVIDTIVPLEKAAEAMQELQQGHTVGKIGVRLP